MFFRRSSQVFVSWALSHKGKSIWQQYLSHWIMDTIRLAYEMTTSWTLFNGVSIEEICRYAFYRLDLTAFSVAHSVLRWALPNCLLVFIHCLSDLMASVSVVHFGSCKYLP